MHELIYKDRTKNCLVNGEINQSNDPKQCKIVKSLKFTNIETKDKKF